jgi:cytosine/adenosine deaminase-related metal-dependent hydrolase
MSNTVNKTKEEIIEYWVGMGGLNVHTGNRGLILGMMTEWADQQTATLQSELAEKDKEIKRMREALEKIIEFNRQQALDQYGNYIRLKDGLVF